LFLSQEAVVLEHRYVAEFALRHPVYNAVDRIVDVTCKDVSRHRLLNRQVMNGTSAFRHHADDVRFGPNADSCSAAKMTVIRVTRRRE
jgi:hypothetical protein